MAPSMDDLKKRIFYDMLDLAGRVFIMAGYSADVVIGKRGFLPEEREKGIVLVFNKRMDFEWTNAGITARLVFGAETHQCFIPQNAIISIFSPELSAQFSVSPPSSSEEKENGPSKKTPERRRKSRSSPDEKVVRVDFNRKK